jgi:hypothetical protein
MPRRLNSLLVIVLLLAPLNAASGQTSVRAVGSAVKSKASYGAERDREIAARFAPIFQQGLGDKRRSDLITSFNFDGDWRGDNNWSDTDNTRFKMRAYVYYAVSETPTHFFIHYAVFHPRDYKGDSLGGKILSGMIREGVKRGGRYDPTGLASGAVLAHENDMEGCLVVAAKNDPDPASAEVVYVETLAHDHFSKYAAEGDSSSDFKRVRADGQHPLLYVEPKGHGISAYDGEEKKAEEGRTLVYRFTGHADDASAAADGGAVGYELLPLLTTLWPRARGGANETYAESLDYGARTIGVAGASGREASRRVELGKLGASFRGVVGAANMARPPWGWFDREEKEEPPGSWFFDPAATIKRHFNPPGDFSTAYLYAPFLGVLRQ